MRRLGIVEQFALRSAAFVLLMALLLGISITVAVRELFVDQAVEGARITATAIVLDHLEGEDLSTGSLTPAARGRLDEMFEEDFTGSGIFAIKLWNPQGTLVYVAGEGTDPGQVGDNFAGHESLEAALDGQVTAEVEPASDEENEGQQLSGGIIEVYAPIASQPGGEPIGVFEVYRAYAPVAASINQLIITVWAIILLGSIPAYFLQLSLVRKTARELTEARGEVAEVNDRLSSSLEELEMHSLGTLQALVAAVDAKDSYTARHSIAVTDYAVAIAKRLGLDEGLVRDVERAGLLHDVGKIGTPESILLKPARLDDDEFKIMSEHSEMGGHIIEAVPFLSPLMPIIRHHHERWDGSGYPDGLAGERIPLLSRVLAVADAFDAMTSERPYRTPVPLDEAKTELFRCTGSQFDSHCVSALVAALDAGEVKVLVHRESGRSKRRR